MRKELERFKGPHQLGHQFLRLLKICHLVSTGVLHTQCLAEIVFPKNIEVEAEDLEHRKGAKET